MSEQREVLPTGQPKRRPTGLLLLAAVPVAIAVVGGLAAANTAPTFENTSLAIPVSDSARETGIREVAVVEQRNDVLAAVAAPKIKVDPSDATPTIAVSFPPEPEPEPAQAVHRGNNSGSTAASSGSSNSKSSGSSGSGGSGGSAKASAPAKSSGGGGGGGGSSATPSSFCSSPPSPYSAGGSVKGLLTAANKERARIGVRSMSWSGSLASAASSWSQTMASRDTDGKGTAIAHNPNRPGGENVAVSGSSGGMSISRAVNNAHAGWVKSHGHCMNLMNPNYSSMGAGSASTANGNAVYTTANFR